MLTKPLIVDSDFLRDCEGSLRSLYAIQHGLVSFISEHKSDPLSAMDFANSLQMSVCVGMMRIMFKLVKIY